jgi:hypothetical protein
MENTMGIRAYVNMLEVDEDQVEQELLDMKYPYVTLSAQGRPLEEGYDIHFWLDENVGEEDYYYLNITKSLQYHSVFFTYSNDALAFKLAFGYK